MNINDIQYLVGQKESEHLEFKKSTSQIKPVCETLCGFLNTNGGTILIGVTDNGHISGQEVTDHTKREIAHELTKIEPRINIQTLYIPLDNQKQVIVLQATKGSYCPYVYDGRPFQRNQSTTIRMTQHRYEQMLVERGHLNYAWDELPAVGYNVTDLNQEEIQKTISQGIEANRISPEALHESIPSVLKRLQLLKDERLTNAAVVLFANEVRPNYPQCHLKMARFLGIDKTGDFLDNQQIYGNAFTILAEASMFIRRHIPIAGSYQKDKFERLDEPAVPTLAIRECLINAICHRDYTDRSSSISVAIFDDRLEIWSNGLLPSGLTIEDLKTQHASLPRNKLIADIFYSRGFIEKWGTGTTKMINLCQSKNNPLPEFKEYSSGLSVTFKFKTPIELITNDKRVQPFNQLSLRQKKIIELLTNYNELSPREILEKLDENVPDRTLRKDLAALKSLGILDTFGQANATRWFKVINQ